jgi:hypothetical protein
MPGLDPGIQSRTELGVKSTIYITASMMRTCRVNVITGFDAAARQIMVA